MKRLFNILIVSLLLWRIEVNEVIAQKDSSTLAAIIFKGKSEIQARSFFMSTLNDGKLTDSYAWSAGAGLGFTTGSYHGFTAGISAFAWHKLWSSDLIKPDSITHAPNRYELGLTDIQSPAYDGMFIRLDNFYLNYKLSKSDLTIGRMKLSTPFLSQQDGRMNSTMAEGLWLNIREAAFIQLNGGWLWKLSPRSTTQWFNSGQTIGMYSQGVNPDGSKSDYCNHNQSAGIALLNLKLNAAQNFRIDVWDLLVDDIMNVGMIELKYEPGGSKGFYQSGLFVHENALNNGGNADQQKTYITKGSQANAFSLQSGYKNEKYNLSLNYTHITGDGRYLLPREWSRDPFYTFLPRERNEGCGNVHAIALKASGLFAKRKLKAGFGIGYYQMPDVLNYRLNKYGLPSYYQVNAECVYSFPHFLKGVDLRFLIAGKLNQGDTHDNLKYVYNKVNMLNFNFVIDFKI